LVGKGNEFHISGKKLKEGLGERDNGAFLVGALWFRFCGA